MISSEGLGPRRDYRLVEIRVLPSTDNRMTHPAGLELLGWHILPLAKFRRHWGQA